MQKGWVCPFLCLDMQYLVNYWIHRFIIFIKFTYFIFIFILTIYFIKKKEFWVYSFVINKVEQLRIDFNRDFNSQSFVWVFLISLFWLCYLDASISSDSAIEGVQKDVETLQDLVNSHDAVFLLLDTRESRWLPTLMAAEKQKVETERKW